MAFVTSEPPLAVAVGMADRARPLAQHVEQGRAEKAEHAPGRGEQDVKENGVPQQRMDLPLDKGLQQGHFVWEGPVEGHSQWRQRELARGDRARAIDDGGREGPRQQSQADESADQTEHVASLSPEGRSLTKGSAHCPRRGGETGRLRAERLAPRGREVYAPASCRERGAEGWPSGRRRTPGKCV